MQCADFERHCEDWLDATPPPEFEAHRRACERCRALAEELAGTRGLFGSIRREPPEPSAAFWARLEEGLSEADRKAEFWALLALSARRTAVALAALAMALGLWVWTHPAPPLSAFDAPQTFLVDDASLPGPATYGQIDRDQVVLTLVARREE